jgi:hypothetical protein
MANELIVQNEEVSNAVATKLDNFDSVEDVMSLAKHLIASKALPAGYNTPEKVLVGIQRSKELGMSPLAGMANLSLINGIPSPSVHLLVAKARQAGVIFTIVKDFEKVFEPVLDASGNEQLDENGKPKVKADVITTIRTSQFKHGRWFDNDISYRWSEAVSAELTGKDNWKKMPK